MDVRNLGPIGQFLSGIGIVALFITAWVAYKNYTYHTQLERLKWLQQLFESFYSSDRYKFVRQQIDFDDMTRLLSLLASINCKDGPAPLARAGQGAALS